MVITAKIQEHGSITPDDAKYANELFKELERKGFSYKCKMVGVLMGNISKCEDEMNYFIEKNLPVILVDDSEMTKIIRAIRKGENIRGVSDSKNFYLIFL